MNVLLSLHCIIVKIPCGRSQPDLYLGLAVEQGGVFQ